MPKQVTIEEGCTGCGLCETICEEVFRMNDDYLAEVYGEVTPENETEVEEAIESCPVEVIAWVE